ncbi:MAG: PepSY-associated TM helix domain-containing protein [Polaromonas sp.]|nr:PepSY-associated TM helix domain-containing protein [Polaromonas sp.]
MTSASFAPIQARRRSLLWRLHFWSALIASPFAVMAAATGLLYVFTPQIESALYAHLDTVTPQSQAKPLDDAVASAKQAVPAGWTLHSVMPAQDANDSVKLAFMPPPAKAASMGTHGGHAGHGIAGAASQASKSAPAFLRTNFGFPSRSTVVYVNPYSADVLGQLPQADRFNVWARKLHSSLMQSDSWRWMIELAASWLMVMLVTGIFLWWPSTGQAALPQAGAKGRVAWLQWHSFIGVTLGLMSAVILTTGLTWSQYAGSQVKWARDASGQTPPRIPAKFKSSISPEGRALNWQQAVQAIRQYAPEVSMQVMAPTGPEGVWRANQMDRGDPTKRFDLLIDAYSGERLYDSGWSEQTAFGKATAIGIPFHRGEFGWWNQALLFIFGAGVVFSIISGWVMYFQRRARGVVGLPRLLPGAWRSVSPWAGLGGLVMLVALPLLAASAAVVVLAEISMAWRSRLKTAGSTET